MYNRALYRTLKCLSGVLAASAVCVGCGEENLLAEGPSPGNGTVIVDYTVGEALTRDVSHTPLPASERIGSLLYLLYDYTGNLVKKREIPGIGDMNEGDWPMKRSTMSWEQREALKDTLKIGSEYSAVFIANADPVLFGGEEVLRISEADPEDVVVLDSVYLRLPRTMAFDDHNMFYLCLRNIVSGVETDRDHPMDCPVMLQRVVCRTDFFSDDYPVWDSDYTRGRIREFTDKVYEELIPVRTSDNPLYVNDMLKEFTKDFAAWCALGGYMAIPGFPAWEADFAIKVNGLDCTPFLNNLSVSEADGIKDLLYRSCLDNQALQGVWRPWSGLKAQVVYSGCADRFYIASRMSAGGADGKVEMSPMLDIVGLPAADGSRLRNSFTFIGFGENPEADDGNIQNRMTEVRLYSPSDPDSPVAVIPLPESVRSFAGQGSNMRVKLNYLPIKSLGHDKTVTKGSTFRLEPVNLREKLSNSLFISEEFVKILQNFFKSDKGKKYGRSIEEFVLEITLPDLSRTDALTIEPEWTVE